MLQRRILAVNPGGCVDKTLFIRNYLEQRRYRLFNRSMVIKGSTKRFTLAILQNPQDQQQEASSLMTSLATSVVGYFQDNVEVAQKTFVRVVFGTFMGSLVVLLILLYAGVPIV
jgi:hypothetical protein